MHRLFCFLILICPLVSLAQKTKLDSLSDKYHRLPEQDTSKVKILIEAAQLLLYVDHKTDSALTVSETALRLSLENNFLKGQSYAYNFLGRIYLIKRLQNTALQNFLKALEISNRIGDKEAIAITHLEIANIYQSLMFSWQNADESAKEMFQQALFHRKQFYKMSKELGNQQMISLACDALGDLFLFHKNYDSAEYYYRKAIGIGMEDGLQITGEINLVDLLLQKGDFLNSKTEMLKIIKHIPKQKNGTELISEESILADVYERMTEIYMALHVYDSAQYFLNRAKKTLANSNDQIRKLALNSYQARIYLHTKQYDKAIELNLNLISEGYKNSLPTIALSHTNFLAMTYKEKGDYKNAYEYMFKFFLLKDSIFNTNTSAALIQQQADYEMLSKNNEVEMLTQDKAISEFKLAQQKLIIFGGVILSVLLIIVVLFSIKRYKSIKKSKEQQEVAFKEMNQLKSRFFANISHEFRTPLTLILTPLEKKIAQAGSPDEKQELKRMHRSASRLLTLVNQLLDLSRLESGSLTLDLRYANLKKFLLPITSQFASISDSKNIAFSVNMADNIELFIDHDKTEKIITNLLSNAFKFTSDQGAVSLLVTKEEANVTFTSGYAAIRVQDNGTGIAPEHLSKIFDRFYQVDTSATRQYEGTGIGLALCKELVELHKGTITVQSEPGKGSVFTVCLELSSIQTESTRVDDLVEFETHYTNVEPEEDNAVQPVDLEELVLIVEDNTDLRQYISQELGKSFHTIEAKNGEEGLALAFEKMPIVIISDLMMPGRDGLQLCEIIKNDTRTSHIPVLLLTARADIETRLKGLSFGADDYVAKPFVMEELRLRVVNMIQSRKRLREKYTQQIQLKPSEIKATSADERFLKNTMEVVELHLNDVSFSVEIFAQEVGMSQAQLYRKLHALTEYSPNEFIRHMRLMRAKDLLRQKVGNVAEVAYQTGFSNLSYFAKCFKHKFGVLPSDFLKNPSV